MITLRKSKERRHRQNGGQDTWMTFDAENPDDPLRMGFRALKSLNEERLAPGAGFVSKPGTDLEVLTYVWEGSLIEEDSSGTSHVLAIGECRRSDARSGAIHRAVNGSLTDPSRAFQCGISPSRKEQKTRTEQKRFPLAERRGVSRLMASPDGKDASLRMRQDIRVYSALLDPGHHLVHELVPGRGAWLQVVKGRIRLEDQELRAGDAASIVEEPAVSLTAHEASEILLFDLA